MIQLISVHEPTESQLAEWLKERKITCLQYVESMNKINATAIPPPHEKPSLISRFLAWLKK